jgi:hypothetical protein
VLTPAIPVRNIQHREPGDNIRTLNLRSELEYSARRMRISGDLLTKPYILIGSSVTPDLRYVRIYCLCLGISDTTALATRFT